MDPGGEPGGDAGKRRPFCHEPTWRRWDVGGGATFYRPRRVGTLIIGEQDLGYVEHTNGSWEWHTRAVPGPQGDFAQGKCPTEFDARRVLEQKWNEYLEAPCSTL